ncbi:hypothetical protein VKT23_008532 [Stygiomarasmius scandens]|uniref:Uncharacterized protein n=1 Tax=Marasmiellus scandens TaxID=2682957 RepID=A0ABR1JJ98_9AGAR
MPAKVRKDKGILSFAVELLQNIGDQIDRLEDKKSLRATCSRLNGALRPQVLSSLTLRIHKHNLESGIALLEALLNDGGFSAVDRWPLISECVRTLYIESLSPSFYPDPDFGTRALPNLDQLDSTRRDWVRDVTDGLKVKEAHKKLESLLGPALRSLSNIRSIHWECDCQRDPNWTAHVTMNSLSHLNFLRRLTITYIPDESDISVLTAIPNFHNLKSFSFITPDSVSHPSRVMNQIVAHLANQFLPENRSLTSFHIDSGIQGYPLHPWLNENLQTIGQLEGLQHLGLKGWNLSSPEEEIRSTSDIWSMLRRDGVHLHHIEIDVVDDHLLSYLSSYSGLVRLSLKDIPLFANVNNGDTNTDKFYEHVLPRHAYSLEHLEILPIFEGRWCFELPAWRALSHCRALRSLAFKVKSQGLPPGTPADRNLVSVIFAISLERTYD